MGWNWKKNYWIFRCLVVIRVGLFFGYFHPGDLINRDIDIFLYILLVSNKYPIRKPDSVLWWNLSDPLYKRVFALPSIATCKLAPTTVYHSNSYQLNWEEVALLKQRISTLHLSSSSRVVFVSVALSFTPRGIQDPLDLSLFVVSGLSSLLTERTIIDWMRSLYGNDLEFQVRKMLLNYIIL